jgi:hypothetical protein
MFKAPTSCHSKILAGKVETAGIVARLEFRLQAVLAAPGRVNAELQTSQAGLPASPKEPGGDHFQAAAFSLIALNERY